MKRYGVLESRLAVSGRLSSIETGREGHRANRRQGGLRYEIGEFDCWRCRGYVFVSGAPTLKSALRASEPDQAAGPPLLSFTYLLVERVAMSLTNTCHSFPTGVRRSIERRPLVAALRSLRFSWTSSIAQLLYANVVIVPHVST